VEVPRLEGTGVVPHILPGKNPFVSEVTDMYHIPQEAVMGGAETMYPEYRKKLKTMVIPRPAVFDTKFAREHAGSDSSTNNSPKKEAGK
jgi:hypothetical protein